MYFKCRFGLLCVALATLIGCSQAVAPSGSSGGVYHSSLGTEWGERIDSRISYVNFEREHEHTPDTAAAIHYDDRFGVKELSGSRELKPRPFELHDTRVEFGLTDEESGWFGPAFLPGAETNGSYVVRGKRGDRYGVYVRNNTDERIEVVLSVDGLDVMNGRSASYSNRGYIIEPGEKLIVEGFRDSKNTVAAFRFAEPRDSYVSEKSGDTANVGVVGLAVFSERGSRFASPPGSFGRANPFPGEFAQAPR
ncbi:MAG: hypothetical protein U0136_16395 [Bdellovibrionota bacterium]